ncbi:hypothetical protein NL676_012684 [Syzygium grande]|nr:hypothetical protein NL676_012684 [Syzygium grande]
MASSDQPPGPMPPTAAEGEKAPGKRMTVGADDAGHGAGDAAVVEAGEADEPARLHLRPLRPRPRPPDRDPPLRCPPQPGLPPVRRLRHRLSLRPPHRQVINGGHTTHPVHVVSLTSCTYGVLRLDSDERGLPLPPPPW